jgi:hypothetical protein
MVVSLLIGPRGRKKLIGRGGSGGRRGTCPGYDDRRKLETVDLLNEHRFGNGVVYLRYRTTT